MNAMAVETLAGRALTLERGRAVAAQAVRALNKAALYALIILSPFRARMVLDHRPVGNIYGDYTNLIVFWSDFALVAVLALWGLSLVIEPRKVWLGPNLVRWPAAALLLMVWLSVPLSTDSALSAFNALRFTAASGLALYAANEVGGLKELIPALAAMVLLQGVVGIEQVLGQADLGLKSLGEYHLNPKDAGVSVVWTQNSPKLLRAYGLTDHPNLLGGLLALALILLATAFVHVRPGWALVWAGVFATGVAAVLLTFSRAAELALVAGVAAVFALLAYQGERRRLLMWAGACVIAIVVGAAFMRPYSAYLAARLNPTEQQTGSTEQRSLSERAALAKQTNNIFTRHPILGVGFAALPQAMQEDYPDFGYYYQPAHFVVMDVAAETGIAGAMAYGFLTAGPFVLLWWRRRTLTPPLIGLSGALVALGVIGLLDYYPWSLAPGQVWAWLVLGLWCGAYARMMRGAADA